MLKVGGIWVSPIEVENCIREHPSVLEVAVVGKEDEQGLVKPMAYVVLREGYEPSPEQLEDEIKKNGFSTDLPNTNTHAG
jgi:4-hydroxybenzoate-CoA ligase